MRRVSPLSLVFAGLLSGLGGSVGHAQDVQYELIHPAYNEVVREPAVVGSRVQRIETQLGYWTATQHPAQYGAYQKSVLVRPAAVSYRVVPAQYQTAHERVLVRRASVRWEYRRDDHGRLLRCAVEVPATYRVIARQVMVSPAHTVAHTQPAVYKTVTIPLLIAPKRVSFQHTPPHVDYVGHPITLQAATSRVIHHPAAYGHARDHGFAQHRRLGK